MLRLLTILVFALTIAAAACGDDDDSSNELPPLSEEEYLSASSRLIDEVNDWIQRHDALVLEGTENQADIYSLPYQTQVTELTAEIDLLEEEAERLSPPEEYASAHADLETAITDLHSSQHLFEDGIVARSESMVTDSMALYAEAVDAFVDASESISTIADGG